MTATINMQFSEATNKTGMYELFQDLTKTNPTSYTAYKYARDANNALAYYVINLAIPSSGNAQFDDSNQTDYPEVKIDLVSGQFDYPLLTDASTSANQILTLRRIEMAVDSNGIVYKKLYPYDPIQESDESIIYRRGIQGMPYRYYWKANSIFIDPVPNYSVTGGLRVFFERTSTYFAGTDTTKVAGIPHAHQEYLVYRPAYLYAVTNLPQLANGYLAIVKDLESKISEYYSDKNKDAHRAIKNEYDNYL